jgi:signal peptidase I
MIWLRPQSLGGRAGYIIVSGSSMRPTLVPGDLVVVRRDQRYRIGQVVTYRIPSGDFRGARIIHRIIGGSPQTGFTLRGDNKPDDDSWHPKNPDIIGRQALRLPGFGRALVFLRSPAVFAALAAGVAFSITMTWKPPRGSGGVPRRRTGKREPADA